MHDDVAAHVIRLRAGVTLGRPLHHATGLTVVPLLGRAGRAGEPSTTARVAGVAVSETVPPSVGGLLVANRGSRPVAVHTGDLFAGGLADRSAAEASVVAPGVQRVVEVEAVEARWWWTGPLVLAGALDPPPSAILALAGLAGPAGGGLSAIARTCLWALGEGRSGGGAPEASDAPATSMAQGWVLLGDHRVLAARMWGSPRVVALGRAAKATRPRRAEAVVGRFLADLRGATWTPLRPGVTEGAFGEHRVRVVHLDGEVVELSAVRLSADLAGALLRGQAAV